MASSSLHLGLFEYPALSGDNGPFALMWKKNMIRGLKSWQGSSTSISPVYLAFCFHASGSFQDMCGEMFGFITQGLVVIQWVMGHCYSACSAKQLSHHLFYFWELLVCVLKHHTYLPCSKSLAKRSRSFFFFVSLMCNLHMPHLHSEISKWAANNGPIYSFHYVSACMQLTLGMSPSITEC